MTRDSRRHLLWQAVGRHLEEGRGSEAAVRAGTRSVSYAELAVAADAGASALDDRFAPGARVVIAARNQLHVGLALAACLRSRALPLLADPTSPERVAGIARRWRAAGAIAEPALLAGSAIPVVDAADSEHWLGNRARSFEPPGVADDEPAFWTFTSGTTGEPRAVVHGHRGPRAAFAAFGERVLRLGPEDVTIATGGLPFVYVLGTSFFFPLFAGGATVLPADLLLPTVLGEAAAHGATVLAGGPWSLAAIAALARRPRWTACLRNLRLVLSAGEPLPPRVFDEWRSRFGKELLDNLGCTEMFNSFLSSVPGAARAGSVGRVVPGYEVRVGGGPPVPGARGPLHVRGESRAIATSRGGEPEPVVTAWCETGDEVAVADDGSFAFVGRLDDRFKSRGRFVHPLEIERRLLEVDGAEDCLVTCECDARGVAVPVARVVPAANVDRGALVGALVRHARSVLEAHQVPARIELADRLSRSARGKLARPRPS